MRACSTSRSSILINEELAKFSPALAERPQIVVGNKCDLATEEQVETFRQYVEGKGLTFVPISAATMQGVKQLPGLVYNRLKDIPQVPVFTPEYKKPEPKKNGHDFTIHEEKSLPAFTAVVSYRAAGSVRGYSTPPG